MGEKTPRRPYAARLPGDQRREQLLDAALKLLSTEGFDTITMASIAREAGVTRPVVYGQFASIAELLDALAVRQGQRALDQMTQTISAMMANASQRDTDDMFIQGLAAFLAAVESDPDGWRLVLLQPPSMPRELRRRIDSTRRQIAKSLEGAGGWALKQRGISDGADIELFMITMQELFEDSARLLLIRGDRFPAERIVRFWESIIGTLPAVASVRAPGEHEAA